MKTLIYFLIFVLMVSVASAESLTRDLPSSATNSFTVTYNVDTTGLTTYWSVLWSDDVSGSGDCYFITTSGRVKHRSHFIMDISRLSSSVTVEADSTGTCSFSGTYQFADGNGILSEKNIVGDSSITITSNGATHKECSNGQCIIVQGSGTDQCQTDSECNGATHKICSNNQCITVSGVGTDECAIDANCYVCTPDCSCASTTCVGQTCSNGCGGTCSGTKSCTDCGNNVCDSDENCESCPDDCACQSGYECKDTTCKLIVTDTTCLPYIQDEINGVCEFNQTAKTLFYILIFLGIISFLK